jgi:hypothetical protein
MIASALRLGGSAQAAQKVTRPPGLVQQPIPVSHKQHCAANIPCTLCHPTAHSGEIAGLPTAAICIACHQTVDKLNATIQEVQAYVTANKPIPWRQIYKVQDFVFFSHKTHYDAKVLCAECHGKVCEKDVLSEEVHLSMMFCIKCHEAKHAPAKCDTCHTLSM